MVRPAWLVETNLLRPFSRQELMTGLQRELPVVFQSQRDPEMVSSLPYVTHSVLPDVRPRLHSRY